MPKTADPITALPPQYREVHYISINERGMFVKLNVLSLVPLVISGLLVFGSLLVYHEELGSPLVIEGLMPASLPSLPGILFILAVLPLHELVHGLMIAHYGHIPRYGAKWLVMFATSDGAVFRRAEFIRIALAPLLAITALGSFVMLFVPEGFAYWVAWAVTLNAAGSIGDLWMTAVALRFEPSILIRDEADSMRIYARRR